MDLFYSGVGNSDAESDTGGHDLFTFLQRGDQLVDIRTDLAALKKAGQFFNGTVFIPGFKMPDKATVRVIQ